MRMGRKKAEPGVDHHDHERIVELTTLPSRTAADITVAALESARHQGHRRPRRRERLGPDALAPPGSPCAGLRRRPRDGARGSWPISSPPPRRQSARMRALSVANSSAVITPCPLSSPSFARSSRRWSTSFFTTTTARGGGGSTYPVTASGFAAVPAASCAPRVQDLRTDGHGRRTHAADPPERELQRRRRSTPARKNFPNVRLANIRYTNPSTSTPIWIAPACSRRQRGVREPVADRDRVTDPAPR